MIDNIPPEFGLPLAAILWITLACLVWRDRVRHRRNEKRRARGNSPDELH